jgi:hypothetical protein
MVRIIELITIGCLTAMLVCCKRSESVQPDNTEFGDPISVNINGYSGHIMEPCLSRDGNTLLFNNLNEPGENTNLHWATKINDSSFQFNGELSGVNTVHLEGVPAIDLAGKFYFVSTRHYTDSLSTIFQSDYSNGVVSNTQLVNGISKLRPGWLNFDVDVTVDGNTLYFVDGEFDDQPVPKSADIVIANKTTNGFERLANSNELLKNVNTNSLEYAACISTDQLELFFTRLRLPVTASSLTEIYVAKRLSKNEPFGIPAKIASITGFAEAPTLTPNNKNLYYHKKENGRFVLYMVKKRI